MPPKNNASKLTNKKMGDHFGFLSTCRFYISHLLYIWKKGPTYWYARTKDKTLYAPSGTLWIRIHRLTWNQIAFWYAAFYFLSVLIFAFFYQFVDIRHVDPALTVPISFADYVHFSIVTQATMGSGELEAHTNSAKELVSMQIVISTLLTAAGAGVVAYGLVKGRARIKFPDQLVYDHYRHELRLVLWNKHMDDLCNTVCKLIVRTKMDTLDFPSPVIRSCEIKLRKNVPQYIGSMAIALVATDSEGGIPAHYRMLHPDKINPMSLLSLIDCQNIQVVLTGNSVTSGGTIIASRKYSIRDIECGHYIQFNEIEAKANRDMWARYRIFGKTRLTEPTSCETCLIQQECFVKARRDQKA